MKRPSSSEEARSARPDNSTRPDNSARHRNLPPSVSPTASTSSWVGAHFGRVSAASLGVPAETEVSVVVDPVVMDPVVMDADKREELNRLFEEQIQAKRVRRDNDDEDDDSCGLVNYRYDIGLDDRGLALISTKKLNRLIKEKGIDKERAKEIKLERRTLKNRGYAANCRVKRIGEETTLEEDITELDRRHAQHQREQSRLRNLIAEQDRLLAVESSDEED